MIRENPSGWWLPDSDTYFVRFCLGPTPRKNGFYRGHLMSALEYVRKWDCAIDVGAHVGFWTWDLAQRFNVVHAFEPTPETYKCLENNTAEFGNVLLHNVAVGHEAGYCQIYCDKLRPGNTGSNYVRPGPPRPSRKPTIGESNYVRPGDGEIEMVALDDLEWDHCDFLKVDVEGFELKALEGAADLIGRFMPVISMEVTDYKFADRYGIPEGSAERWLLKRGYKKVWHERPDAVFVPS